MAWEHAYTNDHIDLLLRLKEIATGFPLVTMPVRSGAGDGILHGLHTTESSTPAETWTITCTNDLVPATFSVVGSTSGAQVDATVGVPYSIAAISFTLTAGASAFQVGDNFVFSTQVNPLVAATQVWEVKRWTGTGAKVVNYLASSVYDGTSKYLPDKAADDSTSSHWVSDNALGNGSWWQVEFDKPLDIRRLEIQGYIGSGSSYDASGAPKDFNVAYSDNGVDFTVDTSFTGQTLWQTGELRSFTLSGVAGAHKFWRINISLVNSGTLARLPTVRFFDVNDKVDLARYGDGYDVILRGPGTAGGDNIYVSLRPDAYIHNGPNWIVAGSVGYASGLDTFNQPSNSKDGFISGSLAYPDHLRLALYDAPFKYWITVSGRVIKVAARFQNISELGYLGYLLQYAPPGQYPFPLLIAGSQAGGGNMSISHYNWQRTDAAHSLIVNPMTGGGGPTDTLDGLPSPARLYTPFNTWRQICVSENGDWSNGHQSIVVWPTQTEENTTYNATMDVQLDGQVPMSAFTLLDRVFDANYGELDGVKSIPGIHAIESIIPHDDDNWVVLNNVFREQAGEFFALRLA